MSIEPIAVHVLTGFLGAGKTTLLNRLLARPELMDTAVVVNEFGEIGLDHLLVEGAIDDVVLLDGGCLCCVASGSLRETLVDLYSRRATGKLPRFRRVIIETSGLADPGPILHALTRDPLLKDRFAARALICVVDATDASVLERYPEAQAQIAMADRIVITKADLAGKEAARAARALIAALNPLATLLAADAVASDPRSLTAGDGPRVWALDPKPHEHIHASGIGSVSVLYAGVVSWRGIAAWTAELQARWGGELLRLKALLSVVGDDRPVLVQGVRGLFDVSRLLEWPDEQRAGRIVAIGRGLDRATLEKGLALLALSASHAHAHAALRN